MRALLPTMFLAGCQCLATPGTTGQVAPLVPGAPGATTIATPPPQIVAIQVPPVSIVPGAVSMGGGIPTPPDPVTAMVPLTAAPDPDPHTSRHRPRTGAPATSRPDTGRPDTAADPGGLTADQIRRVVSSASGRVRRCYEPRLQNTPDLRGRVTVAISVAADGSVSSADVRDSFDVEIGGCVANVLSSLSFPATPVGGTAVVPFDFSPPDAPAARAAGDPLGPTTNPNQL